MGFRSAVTMLFNRARASDTPQVSLSAPQTIDPTDKLGDPLAAMRPHTVDHDYRRRLNRGETALPTWALHEALRVLPMIGNYARLWCDSIGRLDWSIKTVTMGSSDDNRARQQADRLRQEYERLNVNQAVRHLAMANLYGYSVLVRPTLDPLNWWNIAREGLYGEWKYNPDLRLSDGQNGRLDSMEPRDYVIRSVEDNCLLEFLRIYLRASGVERYWDDNLEKESKRQVVIIPGNIDTRSVTEFKSAALDIMLGKSGTIAGGTGDRRTEVLFPPESRGLPYYENRLKLLDEWACKCLFGAPLVANTAPDSGTLAGNAHADTATTRIMGAAAQISSVLQEQFDRVVLEDAGLLSPGEAALAYFTLAPKEQADPAKEIEWTAALATAGWARDEKELSERTGMKLVATQPPANGDHQSVLWNRIERLLSELDPNQPRGGYGRQAADPASDLVNRAAESIGVPDSWLGPVRRLLSDIAAKAPEEITPDYAAATLAEIKSRLPELFGEMDIDAFADLLEEGMGTAAVEGVRDAIRKRSTG